MMGSARQKQVVQSLHRIVCRAAASPLLTYHSSVSGQAIPGRQLGEVQRAFNVQDHNQTNQYSKLNIEGQRKYQIGENVSRRDKIKFLVTTLLDLKDSKEAIYGALDAWVAWEQNFPIAALKNVILTLEKEQQWHRVIQVIKWMLSKGQGNTMGTYVQLIQALDMDQRADEAHEFWMKKIGSDLHSVPWQLCRMMIGVYYRNNMLENLVKLFKGLEAFDRKPPEKSIVQRVANAYETLGLLEEKERVLEKYKDLFAKNAKENKKSKKTASSIKGNKKKQRNNASTSSESVDGSVKVMETYQ